MVFFKFGGSVEASILVSAAACQSVILRKFGINNRNLARTILFISVHMMSAQGGECVPQKQMQ